MSYLARLALAASPVLGCSFSVDVATDAARPDARPDDVMPPCGATFHGVVQAAAPSTTSGVTVGTPAGAMAGDVMVAAILYQADSDESIGSVSAPSGWTLAQSNLFGGNGAIGQRVFWKPFSPGETSHHFDGDGTSMRYIAQVLVYGAVDLAAPLGGSSGSTWDASRTITAPTLSVNACTRVVGVFGTKRVTSITPPTSLIERSQAALGTSASISLQTADAVFAGATGPQVASTAAPADAIGQLIALSPAP
jgi:hypothetical protein